MANGLESAVFASERAIFKHLSKFFEFFGEASGIAAGAIRFIFSGGVNMRETMTQMALIGVNSVPIVLVTIGFSGAVLALYSAQLFVQYGVGNLVGGGISLTIARELAPVLTAVVVAARAGSAIAAEIGTMKVTEQVDAIRSLGTSPIQHLVAPRLLALVIMLPILAMLGMIIGSYGGYVVAMGNGVSGSSYIESTRVWLLLRDVTMGLVKTLFFGFFIAIVGCQQGLSAEGGAAGVGKNTMNAVVISMILIYVSNYFLAYLMFGQQMPGF